MARAVPGGETKDTDYVFLTFVLEKLPQGLVGLLLAVILCARPCRRAPASCPPWARPPSSTFTGGAGARASPTPTTCGPPACSPWPGGCVALVFAAFASLIDNLIQAVNIVGSLFYGTILGVFLVAFFTRRMRGTPVFLAALVSEAVVITCYKVTDIGFLWFNVIGCVLVAVLAVVLDLFWPRQPPAPVAAR